MLEGPTDAEGNAGRDAPMDEAPQTLEGAVRRGERGVAPEPQVRALMDDLCERGWSIATAESLTGGAVAARLCEVPGAGRCVAGGITAYATPVKRDLLGVEADVVVSERAAREMALAVRALFEVDVGLSVTGVAGPERQDGVEVGTVFVCAATPETIETVEVSADGRPDDVRTAAVAATLAHVTRVVGASGRARASHPTAGSGVDG